MISLLKRILFKGAKLSPLEILILNSVRKEIEPGLWAIWDKQIASINKVQRLPGGVEVNFYRMNKGRPTFDSIIALPIRDKELLLAKVDIVDAGGVRKLSAFLWCVDGFLFSIEYSESSDYFEEAVASGTPSLLAPRCELLAEI